MSWLIVFSVILLCNKIYFTNGEFYSSIHKMTEIMNLEVQMLENMQKFINKNENKLFYLKERLADYERERDEALLTGPVYFENPVNKYLLSKRLTADWEKIENILQYKEGEKFLKKIEKHNIESSELDGALDGVLRLQDVYRLNTSDIARGLLQGIQYDTNFKSRHCFDMGKRALDTDFPKLAFAWFSEALQRFAPDEGVDKLDINLALVNAKYKLGDIQAANQTYTELISEYPDNENLAKLFAEFSQEALGKQTLEVDYSIEHKPPPEDITTATQPELFKLTCAGLVKKTPSDERHLRCGYLTETHEFLILAPIKVEELFHDPLLVVFYDVLSDKEIESIKEMTTAISRATVMSDTGSVVSKVRTSQFQFIPVTHHPVLATIDRRVEDMTNLNMKYAEEHQFANYGIGGHYGEHHDWFLQSQLSDVEQGGGTAFPYLKTLMMPKKGSAAFWFNLHASGDPDQRTLHGACPIVVGSKWVQNRWIREHDQSDRRPCYSFNDIFIQ